MYSKAASNVAIQIGGFIKDGETTKCYLDGKSIEQIVMNNAVEDLPIAVISIAGVARSGKSFLLNFMVSYLEHLSTQTGKDFRSAVQNICGVNWAGGNKTVTKGIWMWGKAFVISTAYHPKVAILLVDTQGTGDAIESASSNVDSQIFYTSLSIATIQIHNINNLWRPEDGQIYEACECAKSIYDRNSTDSQQMFNSLILLYRNWVADEHFGNRPDNFNEQLVNAKQCYRTHKIMAGIDKAFKFKDSFMLPEPSKLLKFANSAIDVKDIGEEFARYLEEFCSELFKHFGCYHKYLGQAKLGKSFLADVKELTVHLSKVSWPSMESAAYLIKDSTLSKALIKATEHFMKKAEEALHADDLENCSDLLTKVKLEAIQLFAAHAAPLTTEEELYRKYQSTLEADIAKFQEFCSMKVKIKVQKEELENLRKEMAKQAEITDKLRQDMLEKEKEYDAKLLQLKEELQSKQQGFEQGMTMVYQKMSEQAAQGMTMVYQKMSEQAAQVRERTEQEYQEKRERERKDYEEHKERERKDHEERMERERKDYEEKKERERKEYEEEMERKRQNYEDERERKRLEYEDERERKKSADAKKKEGGCVLM